MNQETYNPYLSTTEYQGELPIDHPEFSLPTENPNTIQSNPDNVAYIEEFRPEVENSAENIHTLTSEAEEAAESLSYQNQQETVENQSPAIEALTSEGMVIEMRNYSNNIENFRTVELGKVA